MTEVAGRMKSLHGDLGSGILETCWEGALEGGY